jgi:hypothetical protein
MVECNLVAGFPTAYRHFFWNELKNGLTAPKAPDFLKHLGDAERAELLAEIRETQSGLPDGF